MNEALLKRHLELVIEANKTTNITRIATWEEGMLLHVQDSLLGLKELEETPAGPYADIGSGAGYPGIPLAIESGRETLLVDSVGKKTAILDRMIEDLQLTNVGTYTGRIEDLALVKPCYFTAITARALSKLSVIMELACPLLKNGGRVICYKALVEEDEYRHALKLCNQFNMKLVSDRTIQLEEHTRRIICFEKLGEPRIKLPRKVGFAQKRPL